MQVDILGPLSLCVTWPYDNEYERNGVFLSAFLVDSNSGPIESSTLHDSVPYDPIKLAWNVYYVFTERIYWNNVNVSKTKFTGLSCFWWVNKDISLRSHGDD